MIIHIGWLVISVGSAIAAFIENKPSDMFLFFGVAIYAAVNLVESGLKGSKYDY